MCDTTAYAVEGEGQRVVLESVDIIRPEDGKVYMRNLFGEEVVFEGYIKEISLRRNKMVLVGLGG